MPLPPLTDLNETRTSLQRAAQVLSAVRKAVTPPLPNALRLSLYVTPEGLSTGTMRIGGDLLLDFRQQTVLYRQPGEAMISLPLAERTQARLAAEVLALLAEEGHFIEIDRDSVNDQSLLTVDTQTASDYAQALYRVFTAVARFRARLFGPQSPIVVWPHGFDLSTLWFSGAGADEHNDPHLNFGFSPGSPGFDRPYFYSYASPMPEGFYDVALPPLVRAVHEPWRGLVIQYDALAQMADPEGELESLLAAIQSAIGPLMNP